MLGWLVGLAGFTSPALAGAPDPAAPVVYRLVEGSTLVDACPVCGRPDIEIPLSGSFELTLFESNPLFTKWQLSDLHFTDGSTTPGYAVTGEGTFEIGGEVAVVQRGSLDVEVLTPGGRRRAVLSCPTTPAERLWPLWKAAFVEEGGTLTSEIHLTLTTAPLREIWYNTAGGLTPGREGWDGGRISPSDILTDGGRRVLEGSRLFAAAGVAAEEAEQADLDAFDVEPAHPGRVLFSPDRDLSSDLLGTIQEGDLVAVDGPASILWRNQELLRAFVLMPPFPDLGLDAVREQPSGEIWFSVRAPGFSERLGGLLGPGDLLSDAGRVIRSNKELLARFEPVEGQRDLGLDGFHVWSSGEVWYTLETGFQDRKLGAITSGDILSDQGYVVARNLDIVREFQPLEDVSNFGLQGLFIVSDAGAPPAKPAQLNPIQAAATPALSWTGPGRVFQVEATDRLDRPFQAASPLLTGRSWEDAGRSMAVGARHYRLRTW